MKRNKIALLMSSALAAVLLVSSSGCGKRPVIDSSVGGGENKTHDITLLLNGWTNTPTPSDDPYRAWIAENYGLNISLNATTDFINSVMIGFSSSDKPDIVSFPDFTSFQSIRNQGVLLEDWTPYLDKMPHFKQLLSGESQSFTKQVLTDSNGKLNAIWTPSSPPTWSLKIREDWANEYRAMTDNYDEKGNKTSDPSKVYIPAGATSTDGKEWMPNSPDDLLNFARYIKVFKNSGTKLDCYGFTTAGGGTSLGTLETWMPLMWGRVPVAPYGFYIDSKGEVQFSVTDGSYQPYLDYLRQINDEKLIDPNWYSQSFANDKRTTYGKIGIQWYPGSITSSTQIDVNENKPDSEKTDTSDWWETYPLPVSEDTDNEFAGFMAGEGLAGNIITVSKQTSMNKMLMEKICAFIDDCYAFYDKETDTYHRGVAYDALRWGVGVEKSIQYTPIENSNLTYCSIDKESYREKNSGAWDWGAWIASSYDGVVQGKEKEISKITMKVAQHNLKTATYKTTPQIGEYLTLDSAKMTDMALNMASFAYTYATRQTSMTVAEYCAKWKKDLKGDELLAEASAQFTALGLKK